MGLEEKTVWASEKGKPKSRRIGNKTSPKILGGRLKSVFRWPGDVDGCVSQEWVPRPPRYIVSRYHPVPLSES